jgi:tRNA (guanine-N7-)-methyltransferase
VAKKKKERLAEIAVLANVFQTPEGLKGCWNEDVFENDNPITLEVGCGRGEYTVNLARKFPERNIIGLDIKGPRLWKGAKTADEEGLHNAGFVRALVETVTDYFEKGEVSEIWVTFPDPNPQPGKAKKRLVSERFLNLYREILKPGGLINFKTDNADLFNWAIESFKANPELEIICHTDDLYHSDLLNDITAIKTTYEAKFLAEGLTIKYAVIRFREE